MVYSEHHLFLLMARLATAVTLPAADAYARWTIVRKGTHKSRKITRALALLFMGVAKGRLAGQTAAGVSANQYYTLKRRYLAQGLDGALEERPRSGQPRKATAALEARITSLSCSELPSGATRWTLSLLNEKLVSLNYIENILDESIRRVLKKVVV